MSSDWNLFSESLAALDRNTFIELVLAMPEADYPEAVRLLKDFLKQPRKDREEYRSVNLASVALVAVASQQQYNELFKNDYQGWWVSELMIPFYEIDALLRLLKAKPVKWFLDGLAKIPDAARNLDRFVDAGLLPQNNEENYILNYFLSRWTGLVKNHLCTTQPPLRRSCRTALF